jgi:hypothetical protein
MAATSTILSNPVVTVNSVVLTGWCTSAVLTRTVNPLSDTVFGDTANTFTAGLEDNELTLTLFLSYAASATYATLSTLVGTKTTVSVKPSSGATGATNPSFTLTNSFLSSLPVLSASLGELQSVDITFQGGSYAAAIV